MILFICSVVALVALFSPSQNFLTRKFDTPSDFLYARYMRSLYSESAERAIYLEPVQGFFSSDLRSSNNLTSELFIALHLRCAT